MSSTQRSWIQRGISLGLLAFTTNGEKVTYVALGKSYSFKDPEEHVRARYYVELVDIYDYETSHIDIEVVVPRRRPSDYADIVVYRDAAHKHPYLVVECKKDGISESEFDQAIEQVFGNANSLRAPFATVVSGNTRRSFDVESHGPLERHLNIIADVPVRYGVIQEFRYKRGDLIWDLEPIDKQDLIRTLAKCHDTLWDGGKMDPTEAFDELSKLIFVKMKDELTPRRNGDPYDFQIKTRETPASVASRIHELYAKAKEEDKDVFPDQIASTPVKVFSVVNHLQGIDLTKTDLDTKGVAFENFMEDFFKGKQGQYFTPREIVSFIVELCNVQQNSLVLDPACGSGGFLLYALNQIREQAAEYYDEDSSQHYRYWHDFAANKLFGIEVNERITRVAKMNMIIHDDGHTNVVCHDALDSLDVLKGLNAGLVKNSFDFVLTNPPFGAKVKKEEKAYLGSFHLGKTEAGKTRKTQESEVLFIERCWSFLKPGTGILAIILPDGILTNHNQKPARKFITDNFEIKAIISLPQLAFAHYGAGAKSSVLILRKRAEVEPETHYEIFSAIVDNVGYDATGRSTDNELPKVALRYTEFLNGRRFTEPKVFTKTLLEFNRNRLDPYYYSPLFDDIERDIAATGYPLKTLREVCLEKGVFAGNTPAKKDYSSNILDPKIVKVATLKNGKVDFKYIQYVNAETLSDTEREKVLRDGDILILSASHQGEYIGKNPCIVELPSDEFDNSLFVAELICIRLDREVVNPYYLLQLFGTEKYYLLVNREKRGQTSHIYARDIKEIRIPVPSLETQNRNAELYRTKYEEYEYHAKLAEQKLADTSAEFTETFSI